MDEKYLSISDAAKAIGVSINTLRRWDEKGRLRPFRLTPTSHRYYRKNDIGIFLNDIFALANEWATENGQNSIEPNASFYCSNKAVFQSRLEKLQGELGQIVGLEYIFPLIVAVTGEIGNNSFDHNLGNWPDIPGIFFAYDLPKRRIVLADRGRGVLETLRRVRPALANDQEALQVAFTEIVSGRAPEERGNGLKFVRAVVRDNPLYLFFQSGTAKLELEGKKSELKIVTAVDGPRGCVALIKF
ncbi:MAG: MerR family transcriptional regulator [Candidatus Magasanikbacteria bacterium]|nr:MerR family transcriptional regulator [Candidatus Magasanikbacteria bacterium]